MFSAGMLADLAATIAARSLGFPVRVPAAQTRSHGNFLDQVGEKLAAPGVGRTFLVLDAMPFGMSRHEPFFPGDRQSENSKSPHGLKP